MDSKQEQKKIIVAVAVVAVVAAVAVALSAEKPEDVSRNAVSSFSAEPDFYKLDCECKKAF